MLPAQKSPYRVASAFLPPIRNPRQTQAGRVVLKLLLTLYNEFGGFLRTLDWTASATAFGRGRMVHSLEGGGASWYPRREGLLRGQAGSAG